MRVETESHRRAVAVTTNDMSYIPVTRALYVGGAGNIVVTMENGEDATLSGVLAGTVYPLSVKRVKATGTTATNLVALY